MSAIPHRDTTLRGFRSLAGLALVIAALMICGDSPSMLAADSRTAEAEKPMKPMPPNYPLARRAADVDDYHGVLIADPYRWLEDPDSPETKEWVTAENRLTEDYLSKVPQRAAIRQRLEKLWNFQRYGIPSVRGGHYFYSRNDGLQNQAVLYTTDSLEGEPRTLLDPNTLSKDGTVALTAVDPSENGKLLAYGLAAAGSDWQEWRVRDVATGKDLEDHLKWIKFSTVSWTPDGKGFYYGRFDEPEAGKELTATNYYQKLFFHAIGDPQSKDKLIYKRDDEKEWEFSGEVTEDGHYLIITVSRGTERKNLIFYLDLTAPDAKVVELIKGWDAQYSFIANDGPIFWLRTDLDAPHSRVIAVDTRTPDRAKWTQVIPESEATLEGVSQVGGKFIASYLKDARSEVKSFDKTGKALGPIELPGLGTAMGFGGRDDQKETFYAFTSFIAPTTIYRYDLTTGKSSVFRSPKVDFKGDDYETKQVFYTSKDGAKVPMFITHKRGMKLDGNHPAMLYGYGGFDISLTPTFSVGNIVWLEMGGVYAVPNLRGGGEYGKAWHEAGQKEKKQNVFDDFIAAAEYLTKEGYTSREKLVIRGGSNGGLLVGAVMTQRPELFGAALPAVGVMDMLRFHKFTIGWGWCPEYGNPDQPEDFKYLRAYSPLHNIRPRVQYPATFITTGDHDDRVVPAHSFKFAAALQAAQAGPAPVLIRIETKAGHGAGKPTSKMIDELADAYTFLVGRGIVQFDGK